MRRNPREYREVLLFQTGFIPVIGDIQSFVEAQTAADYLFALLGVVPGVGEKPARLIKRPKPPKICRA